MTINSQGEWASAIEDAEQVMLRWGHGQVRRVPDEVVAVIVAALRAPVSEQQRNASTPLPETGKIWDGPTYAADAFRDHATPRTDAAEFRYDESGVPVVAAGFARQLERELAEADARYERLRQQAAANLTASRSARSLMLTGLATQIESVADRVYALDADESRVLSAIAGEVAKLETARSTSGALKVDEALIAWGAYCEAQKRGDDAILRMQAVWNAVDDLRSGRVQSATGRSTDAG